MQSRFPSALRGPSRHRSRWPPPILATRNHRCRDIGTGQARNGSYAPNAAMSTPPGDCSVAPGVSSQLRQALPNAGILGMPTPAEVVQGSPWEALPEVLNDARLPGAGSMVTDWNLHRLLHAALLYRQILTCIDRLPITSNRDVRAAFTEVFGVPDMYWYPLSDLLLCTDAQRMRHFPARSEALRQELDIDFPGNLFLVGAGKYGKIYCSWIKERGGIAIDVGELFRRSHSHDREAPHEDRIAAHGLNHSIDRQAAIDRYNAFVDCHQLDAPGVDIRDADVERLPAYWHCARNAVTASPASATPT